MDIGQIRQALKTALAPLDVQVYPLEVGNPQPPCIEIATGSPFVPNYHGAMAGGLVELNFVLRCTVGLSDIETAQQVLDQWMSAGTESAPTILDTLYTDATLNSVVSHIYVESVDNYQGRDINGQQCVTADMNLTVRTTRT